MNLSLSELRRVSLAQNKGAYRLTSRNSVALVIGHDALLQRHGALPHRSHSQNIRPNVIVECVASGSNPAFPLPNKNLDNQFTPSPSPLPKSITILSITATTLAWWFFAASSAQNAANFATLSIASRSFSAEAIAAAVRSAWAGLAAGCLHTLAGADHLAALTPLTIGRSHLRASLLGALWGFGHSTGQLILGLMMVILKDRFEQLVPALSKWGGTTVGLTLLAIGALGVYESYFEHDHDHHHLHHEATATSEDKPSSASSSQTITQKSDHRRFRLATFITGIVYGLQPDALFVIIPALALPTKLAAVAYILMFVLGTVAAMGAYTGVIGATSAAMTKTNSNLTKNLSGFASLVAILIGSGVLLSGWGIEFGGNIPIISTLLSLGSGGGH